MKRVVLIFIIGILLTSFLFAALENSNQADNSAEVQTTTAQKNQVQANKQNQNTQIQERTLTQSQIQKAIQVKNRLRIQVETGECPNSCTCTDSVTKCEFANGTREMTIRAGKSGNTIIQVKGISMSTKVALYKADDGEVYGVFKNNNTKRIKIMPDEIQARLTERVDGLEEHEIELDEDGEYQVQARKKARLFGFIPIRKKVKIQMDSETGEIIRERTSWWGFLAKDDLIVGNKCATVSPDSREECCQNKGFDSYNQETGECETQPSIEEIVE